MADAAAAPEQAVGAEEPKVLTLSDASSEVQTPVPESEEPTTKECFHKKCGEEEKKSGPCDILDRIHREEEEARDRTSTAAPETKKKDGKPKDVIEREIIERIKKCIEEKKLAIRLEKAKADRKSKGTSAKERKDKKKEKARRPHMCVPLEDQISIEDDPKKKGMPKKKQKGPAVKLQVSECVIEACKPLELGYPKCCAIKERMKKAFRRGLSKEMHDCASIKCFPTYVQDLPTQKECGRYLALDLGGTNFRVLLVTLQDDQSEMISEVFVIPPETIVMGTGEQLFDFIAECLVNFRVKQNIKDQKIALGFTFSFPLRQEGLTKGILIKWTKGFNCTGVVGEDVCRLLKEALKRKGDVGISVCAILNDTTGTLMSLAWKEPRTRIGLIVGTGSNACYVEKSENVETFEGDPEKPYVIINTEWGNFGAEGELDDVMTEFDKTLNENTINCGEQVYEKMISGLYQGELVRLIMMKLASQMLMFDGYTTEQFCESGSFISKYVTQIESDELQCTDCECIFTQKFAMRVSKQDCFNIAYICKLVTTRAAILVAIGVTALIEQMDTKDLVVGVDGSVYKYHTTFGANMKKHIAALVGPSVKFELMLSEDGSGRGAALVAAASCKYAKDGTIEGAPQEEETEPLTTTTTAAPSDAPADAADAPADAAAAPTDAAPAPAPADAAPPPAPADAAPAPADAAPAPADAAPAPADAAPAPADAAPAPADAAPAPADDAAAPADAAAAAPA